MILTCPNCATCYEIAADGIGPAGRNVRCAACKTQWHAAKPEEPIELDLSTVTTIEPVKPEPKPVKAKELPKLYREMMEDKKRNKALVTQGIVWGGMAATFVAVLALGFFLRVDIVRTFPGTANAYAMAGLPVNAAGLEFVSYKVAPAFKGGRFVVSVNAEVRNLRDEDTPVPPVKAKILDANNETIASILVPSNGLVVAPKATRTLVFDVPDAKNMASSLELMFDLAAMKSGGKPHRAKAAEHGDTHGDTHGNTHDKADGEGHGAPADAETSHAAPDAHADASGPDAAAGHDTLMAERGGGHGEDHGAVHAQMALRSVAVAMPPVVQKPKHSAGSIKASEPNLLQKLFPPKPPGPLPSDVKGLRPALSAEDHQDAALNAALATAASKMQD